MKIAVTGGAGFIGSHIVDAYIAEGHDVVVLDNFSTGRKENVNKQAGVEKVDITDAAKIRKIFEKEKFDIVNHHAAQVNVRASVDNPVDDATINILGGINVYESARATGVKKVIFASSGGAVYGEQRYFPADEKHPKRPFSPYGVSKHANEKYLVYYKMVYGIEDVILRYTNVYGPRQNPQGEAGVIAIFTEKMLKNEQPIINGDGTQTRDYVYVNDIVRANVLALTDKARGIYNCSTGVEFSVNTVFQILKLRTGCGCKIVHGDAKPGEQQRSVCSYRKIEKSLGWKPEFNLELGIAHTVEWFRQNTTPAKK